MRITIEGLERQMYSRTDKFNCNLVIVYSSAINILISLFASFCLISYITLLCMSSVWEGILLGGGGGGGDPRGSPPPPPPPPPPLLFQQGCPCSTSVISHSKKYVTLQVSSLPQYQQSCCCHISSLPHCRRISCHFIASQRTLHYQFSTINACCTSNFLHH